MSTWQPVAVIHRTDNAMAERKGTKNSLQNTTHKTDDRSSQTALKSGNVQESYLSISLSAAVAVLDS